MSDGQITNGQREAHALDSINAHAQSSSRPPGAIRNRSRITDPEGARFPTVAIQIERVPKIHGPIDDRAGWIAHIDKQVGARVHPIDPRDRPLQFHLAVAVIGRRKWGLRGGRGHNQKHGEGRPEEVIHFNLA